MTTKQQRHEVTVQRIRRLARSIAVEIPRHELTATGIAEAVVDSGAMGQSVLDDDTHWLWDVAADVADEFANPDA